MSSTVIEALEHPVPIRSGDRTVALLVPLGRSPGRDAAWERFAKAAEEARRRRTPEEQAELDRFLDDYEAHRDDPA